MPDNYSSRGNITINWCNTDATIVTTEDDGAESEGRLCLSYEELVRLRFLLNEQLDVRLREAKTRKRKNLELQKEQLKKGLERVQKQLEEVLHEGESTS